MAATSKVHILEKAKEIIPKLHREGFRDVQFIDSWVYGSTLEDFLSDGLTKEDWEDNIASYCCAGLQADPYDSFGFGLGGNEYTEIEFDIRSFEKDVLAYLIYEFGADVEFQGFNLDGNEFYITRNQNGKTRSEDLS